MKRKTALLFLILFSILLPRPLFAMGGSTGRAPGGNSTDREPWFPLRTESSIAHLFELWTNVEAAWEQGGAAEEALGGFLSAAEAYTNSTLFRQYKETNILPGGQAEAVTALVRSFRENEDEKNRRRTAMEIRQLLVSWQSFEHSVSRTMFAQAFNIFIFSVILFGLLFIAVWRLLFNLRHSRRAERESDEFSRRIMLAQEEERARISAELHDTVLQDLSALVRSLPEPFLETGQRTAGEVRRICRDIMPPDFRRLSLGDSLVQLCLDFEKRSGIVCTINVEENIDTGTLGPEEQLQVYRVAQEALTNIEKHSGASRAELAAGNFRRSFPGERKKRNGLLLRVADNGRNPADFAPGVSARSGNSRAGNFERQAADDSGGLGIPGMYRRAALLGAELRITAGFALRLEAPL